ncbi:hypothetical protein J437_LFUL007528 [Ladona fulva]|uniref:KCTD8/12/16 H1 domain-containing protein n=1 Tax=Ladona fulva TaxID=123851 RepID=A0A8K0NZZ9_LADFU|nr:hypothetical protein J437_LFUL007528 [Ladona fulva]
MKVKKTKENLFISRCQPILPLCYSSSTTSHWRIKYSLPCFLSDTHISCQHIWKLHIQPVRLHHRRLPRKLRLRPRRSRRCQVPKVVPHPMFGETLNESRDPDHSGGAEGERRYTSRFFLKHSAIEQAFDMLGEAGFKHFFLFLRCVASCGSGTAGGVSAADLKPGVDAEENRWNHYNEFVFVRC